MANPAKLQTGTVFLLDSIGELASVYSLATLAFVGGSLVPAGGHNPLEAAQFRLPVVMGPHYENFRAIVERLHAARGIRIIDTGGITAELASLLDDEQAARALGERAYGVFMSESGATARAVNGLLQVIGVAS
jgi:3-deoxy-D-manno-octulosonic-acid transferase